MNNKKEKTLNKITTKSSVSKPTKKHIVIGALSLSTLSAISFLLITTPKLANETYKGIYISSEHIGGMNEETLRTKLSSILNNKLNEATLYIYDGNKTTPIDISELNLSYDIENIIKEAISHGKNGNILHNISTRLSTSINGHEIQYSPIIDEEALDKLIESISSSLSIEASDAKIEFLKDSIKATPESTGLSVNKEQFRNDLLNYINSNFSNTNIIDITYDTTKPTFTKDMAEKLEVLGSFKTKLPSKTGDRTSNIKLYSSKLNKVVLMPGEEFSCDVDGGSRTRADGYKNAPGYVNGEVVPILAGGICQVTSTLYRALLYADLEILERYPHSMPVTYSEIGLDAAIAKGIKDLRFRNNTQNPIVLQVYVDDNGYMVSTIWGIPEVEGKKVELFTKKHNEKSADAYKKIYIDGELVETKLLSKDRYK